MNAVAQPVKVLFMETGTYDDHFIRPYQSTMTDASLNDLYRTTNGGQHISTSALAGIAQDIMRPTAIAQGVANIPNGWGERRFRFLLEVEIDLGGYKSTNIYYGYTDHFGLWNNMLDPNMALHINSCCTVSRTSSVGAHGVQENVRLVDSAQVLAPKTNQQDPHNTPSLVSTRPRDVFQTFDTGTYYRHIGGEGYDTRLGFGLGAKKSLRANNNPAKFLNRTLQSYKQATETETLAVDAYETTATSAIGLLKEPDMGKDMFTKQFNTDPAYSGDGSIRWGDIVTLFPYIEESSRLKVILRKPNDPTHRRGDTDGTGGSDLASMTAATLSGAIPNILLDCMCTRMIFVADNLNPTGEYNTKIVNAVPFLENIDSTRFVNHAMERIVTEVLSMLSRNTHITFQIYMDCNVMGDTEINLDIGGESSRFVFASFGDSLTAPTIARDSTTLTALSEDIATTCRMITQYGV